MTLTTAEVASRLKVSSQNILYMVGEGKLPAKKTSTGYLFKSEDVDQLSKQREEKAQERERRTQEREERRKLQIRQPGQLLLSEVALLLQVSGRSLKEAVQSGKLPAQQTQAGRLLFRSEDVEEFKADREKRRLERQQAVTEKAQLAKQEAERRKQRREQEEERKRQKREQAAERRKQRRVQEEDVKEIITVRLPEEENQDFTVAVYLLGTQKNKLMCKYVEQVIAQVKENDPKKFAETKKQFIKIWKNQGRAIKTQE